jgi:hypothetical protein
LAHISDGYTPGSLKMAVERVLTPKRVSEVKNSILKKKKIFLVFFLQIELFNLKYYINLNNYRFIINI